MHKLRVDASRSQTPHPPCHTYLCRGGSSAPGPTAAGVPGSRWRPPGCPLGTPPGPTQCGPAAGSRVEQQEQQKQQEEEQAQQQQQQAACMGVSGCCLAGQDSAKSLEAASGQPAQGTLPHLDATQAAPPVGLNGGHRRTPCQGHTESTPSPTQGHITVLLSQTGPTDQVTQPPTPCSPAAPHSQHYAQQIRHPSPHSLLTWSTRV
jgi:hypothetical protein